VQQDRFMPIAMVTGASRGVGRGVAISLVEAGYRVFGTGRTIDRADLPEAVTRLNCDHRDDLQTSGAFSALALQAGGLDLLVNCAWGGYERMDEDGVFTWPAPFWEQPVHRWSAMFDGGVRAAFVCAGHAARLMIPQGRGLIVNLSFWAARTYLGNAIYGAAQAATDKMTADMAQDLKPFGVNAISLYPGLVRTERVLEAAAGGHLSLDNSESPQFTGRVIAALAASPAAARESGRAVVGAAIARELGVIDIDETSPEPLKL
jgi:NAD(P)-dependent dehydrogenase (short-subunit alcohol dehydrogenase family)